MAQALRIIFAGSGEFGLPTLGALTGRKAEESAEALADLLPLQVVQVFSQPARPAGRGRKLAPTPISQFAIEHDLPLIRTSDINAESLPPADLMIVIAFGQKISEAVANHPRLGSVNLHSSRLPKYRGAAPINWAIIDGEAVTGNSIIRLAQRMDAGGILAMSTLRIGELETAGELHDRLAADGVPLMLQTIRRLVSGTAEETVQDESQATKAAKLNRDATKIDWSRPAREIANQIRGMYPWPGCRVRLIDATGAEAGRLTLVRGRATGSAGGTPGQISADGSIVAADGSVEIVELQPEGKRPMPLAAYQNGHPWTVGVRVESIA
jgi:methionyl-tRNA formyltransferase